MIEDTNAIPGYLKAGNWKKILQILKRHTHGLTKDEIRHIELGLEYLNKNNTFYSQIGVNCLDSLRIAKRIVIQKFTLNCNENSVSKL